MWCGEARLACPIGESTAVWGSSTRHVVGASEQRPSTALPRFHKSNLCQWFGRAERCSSVCTVAPAARIADASTASSRQCCSSALTAACSSAGSSARLQNACSSATLD